MTPDISKDGDVVKVPKKFFKILFDTDAFALLREHVENLGVISIEGPVGTRIEFSSARIIEDVYVPEGAPIQ